MTRRRLRQAFQWVRQRAAERRTELQVLILVAALAAEIFLLWEYSPLQSDALLKWVLMASVILLPLAIISTAARLPFAQRFITSRYIVRPFGTLHSKSEYDGKVVASLLYRDIAAWQTKSQGSLAGGGTNAVLSSSISLGVTSVPLEWLWAQLRYLITGRRDVLIEGLILDKEAPIKLMAWTSVSAISFEEPVPEGSVHDALAVAIGRLTLNLLKSIDSVFLAEIHAWRCNYDVAIDLLLEQRRTPELNRRLAELNVEADRLEQANQHLAKLGVQDTSSQRIDVQARLCYAELLLRRGELTKAQGCLRFVRASEGVEPSRVHEVLAKLGDSFAFERNYQSAIKHYDEAQQVITKELCRLSGEKSMDDPLCVLNHNYEVKTREDIYVLAHALCGIANNRWRCLHRLGHQREVTQDLDYLWRVVEVTRTLAPVGSGHDDLQVAVTAKALAHHYFDCEDPRRFEAIRIAVQWYDTAIGKFLDVSDPDLRAKIDLAWSYQGKTSCLARRLAAENSSCPEPIADAVQRLVSTLNEVTDQARNKFEVLFWRLRALAQSPNERYQQKLRETANSLVESLAQASTEEVRLDADDAERMYDETVELLRALVEYPDEAQLRKSISAAVDSDEATRCLNLAATIFEELRGHAAKRIVAEGWYGGACIWAMGKDASQAAAHLHQATEEAGENTRAYVNRSILDEDFDSVRADPEFESVYAINLQPVDEQAPSTLAVTR